MVVTCCKIHLACQTNENGIKPGSNLDNADTCKRVAERSRAEFWGIK